MLHALALLAIGAGAWTAAAPAGADLLGFVAAAATPDVDIPTLVDLTALDSLPPTDVVPVAAPAAPVPSGPLADQARVAPANAAQPAAGDDVRRAPAPDRGAGQGASVEDPAFRRDSTTLHERLSDGAERYQPSHARTATRASSPQAVRREPRTGLGDSAHTRQAQRAPVPASYGVDDPTGKGAGAATTDGVPARAPAVPTTVPASEAARAILASSEGPLDAETGERTFDVERIRATSADDRMLRAASHEDHPAITDLTLAAVSGHAAEGRGSSDTPGAVPHASAGTAPVRPGTRGAFGQSGATADQATRERGYDRYKAEIRDRVQRALVFPRSLAVRLEQGETILHFVVRTDGKLEEDAIRLVKSSGFDEFDQAARDAVRKASPFHPMPDAGRARSLEITLRVPFSNPVIR